MILLKNRYCDSTIMTLIFKLCSLCFVLTLRWTIYDCYRISSQESSSEIVSDSETNFINNTCNSEHISITIEHKLEDELSSLEQTSGCRSCARRKANLTREELRELRFEVVKQQILQKLHMTEPPCPPSKPPSSLRAMIQAAEMMDDIETEEDDETPDEMDGKAKSVIVYSLDDALSCVNSPNYPCTRLQFELPSTMGLAVPSSAVIWLYKRNLGNLLRLSEISHYYDDDSSFSVNDLVVESGDPLSRLVKFQLPSRASWLTAGNNEQILDVQISCYSGCSMDSTSAIADTNDDEKPFLVANFQPTSSIPRSRRSVDCTANSIHCCRENLYINFTELGWNNWIQVPSGFEASFCKGKCQHDVNSMRTYHSTILYTYMLVYPEKAEEIGLKMCCSPSKMSDVTLIYVDFKDKDKLKDFRNNNNNTYENITIVKTTLKDMKVDSCDCA